MIRIKQSLALLGFYALALIALETGLRGVFAWRDRSDPPPAPVADLRAALPAYEGATYDPVETWREIWDGSDRWLRYEPYTVWRRSDNGALVSVDERGRRATHHNSSEPDALEVWTLGGSTMWGMGVPDAETIPSHLARLLNQWGVDTRVSNLGRTGFVSMQEVLELLRALQSGSRPDIVVVYDGANEAIGAVEAPEIPNPHYLMKRIRGLFEGEQSELQRPWRALLEQTAFYRLSRSLRARSGLLPEAPPTKPREAPPTPPNGALGAEYLARNYGFIDALAVDNGFVPFFFFQPRPGVGEKPLHESEREILAQLAENPEQVWILEFTRALRAGIGERIERGGVPRRTLDIADVFADVSEAVYIDWVHVSHRGNRIVAQRLFEILQRGLCEEPPPRVRPVPAEQLRVACGRRA